MNKPGNMENKKKILVVEDDAPSALLLVQILKKYGYTVFDPVDTGEKAVQSACEMKPDLIMMDITLKGEMDGITAAQTIRDKCQIPCIYSTVSTDDGTIKRAKETIPYGYILKPYEKNMIYATVEMALNKIDIEKRYREIEERNRAILEVLPDTVFYIARDGSFINDHERELAGHLWTARVAEKALPVIGRVIDERETDIFEYALKRPESTTYLEARMIPSGGDQVLMIVRDVTSKKIAEERLLNYQKDLETQVNIRTREISDVNKNLEHEVSLRQKMQQNVKMFSHAIEQNPHIVAIVEKNGTVDYVNTAFTQISGRNADDVIGTNVLKHGNLIIPEPEIWRKMIFSASWKGELYNIKKDGTLYYLRATVAPIKDDEGTISHYIITAEDISEAKREKMALDQVKEALEKSALGMVDKEMDWKEWKDKMMERNITRTDKSLFKNIHNSFTQGAGFGTLVTLIDMMISGADKTDDRLIVDSNIIEQIQKNVNMVKDAFKTFSSIDWIISNDFELTRTSMSELYDNVKAVISKAVEYTPINQNRIIINDFNPRFKDFYVNLNREYLFKALFEVLINAMKFSKKKAFVTVLVNVAGKDAVISVINDPEKSDEGITGIPPEYEKVVFEPFYRLTKFVYEQYNTLEFGLGLPLVEKIVGKHGGEVMARNIIDHSDTRRESQVKVNVSVLLPIVER